MVACSGRCVLFFLSLANAGTGRILLLTPCNRRCRRIQEFCYRCLSGLVAQESYILNLASYLLSTFFHVLQSVCPSLLLSKVQFWGPQAQILLWVWAACPSCGRLSCPCIGTAPTPATHSSFLPAPRCRVPFLASWFPWTSSPLYLLTGLLSSPSI